MRIATAQQCTQSSLKHICCVLSIQWTAQLQYICSAAGADLLLIVAQYVTALAVRAVKFLLRKTGTQFELLSLPGITLHKHAWQQILHMISPWFLRT